MGEKVHTHTSSGFMNHKHHRFDELVKKNRTKMYQKITPTIVRMKRKIMIKNIVECRPLIIFGNARNAIIRSFVFILSEIRTCAECARQTGPAFQE